jgi:hypothetical protein
MWVDYLQLPKNEGFAAMVDSWLWMNVRYVGTDCTAGKQAWCNIYDSFLYSKVSNYLNGRNSINLVSWVSETFYLYFHTLESVRAKYKHKFRPSAIPWLGMEITWRTLGHGWRTTIIYNTSNHDKTDSLCKCKWIDIKVNSRRYLGTNLGITIA